MSDLTIVIVVPKPLKYAMDQLGAVASGVETTLAAAKVPMKVELEFVEIAAADGKVYAEDFRVYRERFEPQWMTDLAKVVAGAPRKKYVVFVCKQIDSVLGVVGFSVNGQAVSCIALPPPKQTIGKGDSQTWTHEICHGLGLTHVDGDPDNLMHPSRHTSEGVQAGYKLTSGQGVNMMRVAENLRENGI